MFNSQMSIPQASFKHPAVYFNYGPSLLKDESTPQAPRINTDSVCTPAYCDPFAYSVTPRNTKSNFHPQSPGYSNQRILQFDKVHPKNKECHICKNSSPKYKNASNGTKVCSRCAIRQMKEGNHFQQLKHKEKAPKGKQNQKIVYDGKKPIINSKPPLNASKQSISSQKQPANFFKPSSNSPKPPFNSSKPSYSPSKSSLSPSKTQLSPNKSRLSPVKATITAKPLVNSTKQSSSNEKFLSASKSSKSVVTTSKPLMDTSAQNASQANRKQIDRSSELERFLRQIDRSLGDLRNILESEEQTKQRIKRQYKSDRMKLKEHYEKIKMAIRDSIDEDMRSIQERELQQKIRLDNNRNEVYQNLNKLNQIKQDIIPNFKDIVGKIQDKKYNQFLNSYKIETNRIQNWKNNNLLISNRNQTQNKQFLYNPQLYTLTSKSMNKCLFSFDKGFNGQQ